jgi:hypothetical protein
MRPRARGWGLVNGCTLARAAFALVVCAAWGQTQSAPAPARRTIFTVRYVAQGAVYIDAGTAEGIVPGNFKGRTW